MRPSGVTFGIRADPVYTCVGLGRLPRAGIVVNIDPAHRGYMWAIECGPLSEGGDCNILSPTLGMSGKIMGI